MSRAIARPRGGTRRRPVKRGRRRLAHHRARSSRRSPCCCCSRVLLFAGIVAGIVASYSRNLPDINRMADYQPSRSTRVFARDGIAAGEPLQREPHLGPDRRSIPVPRAQRVHRHRRRSISTSITASISAASCAPRSPTTAISSSRAPRRSRSSSRAGSSSSDEVSSRARFRKRCSRSRSSAITRRTRSSSATSTSSTSVPARTAIEAAAHTYFGTDVAQLDARAGGDARGAAGRAVRLLAVREPAAREGTAAPRARAHGRRATSSRSAQADAAERAPLGLIGERPQGLQSYRYPYFTTYVTHLLEDAVRLAGDVRGRAAGLHDDRSGACSTSRRKPSLGASAARSAEGIGAHQGALVAIRPSTGEILAMVGGADAVLADAISSIARGKRAASRARRSKPTSTPRRSTRACRRRRSSRTRRSSYPMGDGTRWAPMDDDNRYLGAITLRYALAQSRNVVAVKLAQELGIDKRRSSTRTAWASPRRSKRTLSLALGSSRRLAARPGRRVSRRSPTRHPHRAVADPHRARLVRHAGARQHVPAANRSRQRRASRTSSRRCCSRSSTKAPGIRTRRSAGRPPARPGTTSSFRDAWFVGLHAGSRRRGVDRQRRLHAHERVVRRQHSGAHLGAVHESGAREGQAKHDFVLPAGEVRRVTLCGTGRDEVFLTGTEPSHTCGTPDDGTPSSARARARTPSCRRSRPPFRWRRSQRRARRPRSRR